MFLRLFLCEKENNYFPDFVIDPVIDVHLVRITNVKHKLRDRGATLRLGGGGGGVWTH